MITACASSDQMEVTQMEPGGRDDRDGRREAAVWRQGGLREARGWWARPEHRRPGSRAEELGSVLAGVGTPRTEPSLLGTLTGHQDRERAGRDLIEARGDKSLGSNWETPPLVSLPLSTFPSAFLLLPGCWANSGAPRGVLHHYR